MTFKFPRGKNDFLYPRFSIVASENCKYCDMAKAAIKDIPFAGVSITTYDATDYSLQSLLFREAGYKTVPQIWVDFETPGFNLAYIGTYNDLVEWIEAYTEIAIERGYV